MKRAAVVFLALALASCVTDPAIFDDQKTREFAVSKDVVWDRLIRYFATNNIQVKTLEKASGVIYAEREISGAPTAWWNRGRIGDDLADCGKDFWAIPAAHAIQMNVYVRELSAQRAQATVTVTFKEIYDQRAGFGGAPRQCNSTGRLELQILDELGKQ